MAQTRTNAIVRPELLVWAREEAGLSLEEAAKKLHAKVDRLSACEQGSERLTINQLRTLSTIYRRPLAFFYLPQPPPKSVSLRDFRRLNNVERQISPALRYEIRRARYRRQVALRLYDEISEEPPRVTATTSLKADPEGVAQTIRQLLGISQAQQYRFSSEYESYPFWREAIERCGVLVFQSSGIKLSEMR